MLTAVSYDGSTKPPCGNGTVSAVQCLGPGAPKPGHWMMRKPFLHESWYHGAFGVFAMQSLLPQRPCSHPLSRYPHKPAPGKTIGLSLLKCVSMTEQGEERWRRKARQEGWLPECGSGTAGLWSPSRRAMEPPGMTVSLEDYEIKRDLRQTLAVKLASSQTLSRPQGDYELRAIHMVAASIPSMRFSPNSPES